MQKPVNKKPNALRVEFDREKDGRWIAEIPSIPGALAYGETKQEAAGKAYGVAKHSGLTQDDF